MNYWLMKSEPNAFSIDDLACRTGQVEPWDGVRNYQARNMIRDDMAVGDAIFFYHSNCDVPGIVGIAKVVRAAYPDDTAFNPTSKHYDPKSHPERPTWFMVDVGFVRKLARTITLAELKEDPALEGFPLVRRGNRLSIMPLTQVQWDYILSLE